MNEVTVSVSEFVSIFNQTLEYAYPSIAVEGELANFRISKNRWVYFDLKDELSSVKFFGTVYQLPGPLEDGMMLRVTGSPRLHNQYGFSVTVQNIAPIGEGAIKRASALLAAKLEKEGLFDTSRKRSLPVAPTRIGLIASGGSAAYHDFIKILNARWGGVEVIHADVQVQGDPAPKQIIAALEHMNTQEDVAVVVITRGGGSPEDLSAFSTEQVTRAVALSRIPTLVAIGHEVDISLAELAADLRASTPSNAAELLVPDRNESLRALTVLKSQLTQQLNLCIGNNKKCIDDLRTDLCESIQDKLANYRRELVLNKSVLQAFNPRLALERGFAIARADGHIVRSVKKLKQKDSLTLEFTDGTAQATVSSIKNKK